MFSRSKRTIQRQTGWFPPESLQFKQQTGAKIEMNWEIQGSKEAIENLKANCAELILWTSRTGD
jgi:hypothetical protein